MRFRGIPLRRPGNVAFPLLVSVLLVGGCGGSSDDPGVNPQVAAARAAITEIPAEYQEADRLYQRDCARCHGEDGLGSLSGPPLLHRIYQPTHHSDAAFLLAVATGVRAHHWNFGDMEPLPGVSPEEVGEITSYVRWLQRAVGIY